MSVEASTMSAPRRCRPVSILKTARKHSLEGNWANSFNDYVVAFRLLNRSGSVGRQFVEKLETEFALTMGELTHSLLEQNKTDELYLSISQALTIYPKGSVVLYHIGRTIIHTGNFAEACGFLQKSLKIDPAFAEAEKYVNITKDLLVSRWHFRMLNDRRRNLSYQKAIQAVVSPLDVVLDIGCGSGLLSFYAAELDATVIACELNEALNKVADKAIKLNHFDNIIVRKDVSTNLKVDSDENKFTTVITEIFDAGLFGENALVSILDAWDRLLIPEGKIVPKATTVYICGVESITLAKKYRVVRTDQNRLFTQVNFQNINIFCDLEEPYDTEDLTLIKDVKYVTDPVEIIQLNFQDPKSIGNILRSTLKQTINLNVLRDCKVDAYVLWFDLILCEGITITSNPRSDERCTAWDVAIFHTVSALDCQRGDKIPVDVEWDRGTVNVVCKKHEKGINFPVSKDVVQILNDSEYINNMIGTVSFSCLHLIQLHSFENISVLDHTPFPIVGLLLLMRGISKLTCPNGKIKPLLEKLAEYNNIELDKILFKEPKFEENIKYEVIINNFIHTLGTLDAMAISMANFNKGHFLQTKGMVLPHRIKMYIRLVNSKYLNEFNRIYDENLTDVDHQQSKRDDDTSNWIDLNASIDSLKESHVWHRTKTHPVISEHDSNMTTNVTDDIENINRIRSIWMSKPKRDKYRIAELMNCYQVTHNTFHPSDEFEKSYMSDEGCVYEDCIEPRLSTTVTVTATSDGFVDAVQSYYKIQMVPNGEEMSTDHIDSFVNNMYHLIDPPVQICKGKRVNVLVFCEDTDAIKMVVDDDS